MKIAALALALVVAALAGGVGWVYFALHRPYAGWTGAERVVDLPKDVDAGSLLYRLAREGVIREPRLARAYVSIQGWDRSLRRGEYRFDRPASMLEVLARLRRGDVLLHPVTIPEGLTLDETAARLEQAGVQAAAALRAAFKDPSPVRGSDPEAFDLEGYLFPDTYFFPRGEPAPAIARAMLRRFAEATGPDFAARARAAGFTPRRALILASLVEKETGLAEERPRVARVFRNRLARGMPLQCDPTVLYALRRQGREVTRLTRADLAFASPWNTYVAPALPPGPICSPGRASLEAVVAAAASDDLYFVAAPGGGHVFSRDLNAHESAVRRWRAYVRSSR